MENKKQVQKIQRKFSLNYSGTKFCISVDGSKYSDYGFEIVFNDLFKKGDKIIVTHICNADKLVNIPFNYLPDTIQNKYETKLLGKLLKTDFNLIFQTKETNIKHAMEQVFDICTSNSCNVLVMGFQGHKADINKKEITRGTIFMVEKVHIPTFIIKDNISRKNKTSGGYNWFIGIENSNSKSFKAFQYALKFIDLVKDKILIFHVKQFADQEEEMILEEIEKFCKEKNLINYEIKIHENQAIKSIGTEICNYVNFAQEMFDFIVVGHNPGKYRNLEASPIIEICKSAQANILYYCEDEVKSYIY